MPILCLAEAFRRMDKQEKEQKETFNHKLKVPTFSCFYSFNFVLVKIQSILLFLSFYCLSLLSFAQKNEIKAIEKALKTGDFSTAKTAVTAAESLLSNMDDKTKDKFYFLKVKTYKNS